MPLNPNGKVDKPALPFPDTAVAARKPKPTDQQMSETERRLHDIWLRLIPTAPSPIPLDESFFDLGGHSLLATRLIFEVRKTFAVNAPLGLVFDAPTLRGLAHEIDRLGGDDLTLGSTPSGRSADQTNGIVPTTFDYAADADSLIASLPTSFSAPTTKQGDDTKKTVFLTGATGFLGAFIVRDLLQRADIAHLVCLVRASSQDAAMQRMRDSGRDRDAWDEQWISDGRLEVLVGDLETDKFGLDETAWSHLATEVDIIIHNGALVHWVFPYSKLRGPNVVATMTALQLAAQGRAKTFSFVSTTAVFETPSHYVDLSDAIVAKGGKGISEEDTLDGSKHGITSGYGQTKWTCERVIMEAGRRGLRGGIVRPSYVVGDSTSAVTNTDDFLWRLIKGCLQIGSTPDIHNAINMTPVDHVARVVALSALQPRKDSLPVYHITARPTIRFNAFLDALPRHGYPVQKTEYVHWRTKLEQHVLEHDDNALSPLLHFVTADLPTSTKSPELDDTNTVALLEADGKTKSQVTVDEHLMALYLAWLVAAGFLPSPPADSSGVSLPTLKNAGSVRAVGRSGR